MGNTEFSAYLAARGFEDHLKKELGQAEQIAERLFFKPGPPIRAWWAQNVWQNCTSQPISSITNAASILRGIQRNWVPYAYQLHRRTELITDSLPPISSKRKPFPYLVPKSPLGSFCLVEKDLMVFSPNCTSPFPNGEIEFDEDKINPPSRAYLKLWETFSMTGRMPGSGERCVDAGATPGGWTWVLANLGADVLAIDRAPLDPKIAAMKGVTFMKHSAFTLSPEEIGKSDWLFSDVICYPEKLYEWIMKWIDSGLCKNFVCTIKMQGDCDWTTLERFSSIPESKIIHLSHNKHELTWIKLEQSPDC